MSEIDSTLSGIIILLLIVVVWKWHSSSSCGDRMKLSCGCQHGKCRCRGYSQRSVMRGCPGGRGCLCGCASGQCGCPPSCPCNKPRNGQRETKEGFTPKGAVAQVTGSGPNPPVPSMTTDNYGEIIKDMSLEGGVADSHSRYCDSLSFAGMPTGSSACTQLEETGRSYGTANFVGLTQRKWCKSRALAKPAPDSRVTPTWESNEFCDIDMDELV